MQIRESVEKALLENAIDLITPELQSGVGHTFGFDSLDLFVDAPVPEGLEPVIEQFAEELQPKWHFAFTVQGLMINFAFLRWQWRIAIVNPDAQDAVQSGANSVVSMAMILFDVMLECLIWSLVQKGPSHV